MPLLSSIPRLRSERCAWPREDSQDIEILDGLEYEAREKHRQALPELGVSEESAHQSEQRNGETS